MGMTLRELIHGEAYCQGMVGDRALKGFAPSGPSGGFLPAKLTAEAGLPRKYLENKSWLELTARRGLDATATELDILDLELELNLFRGLSPTQALGAGVVVYAEGRDMAVEALNSIEFYRVESCGKCVPCRLGSQKLASLAGHLVAGKISAAALERRAHPAHRGDGQGDRARVHLRARPFRPRAAAHRHRLFRGRRRIAISPGPTGPKLTLKHLEDSPCR